MITTVIFDLDDTLYDEIEYYNSGFRHVSDFIATLPDSPPPKRVFKALWEVFNSGNRTKTFNTTLEKMGMSYSNELINKLIDVHRNHIPQITLPAESRLILQQLSNKYSLGLLTDGFLPAQRLKVQALDIERYFKCIIYTEDLGRQFWKPSPAGFEKILEQLKANPQETAYVGDNEKKDFLAPNGMGIHTIRIIRQRRIHTERCSLPGAAADHTIDKIGQLPRLLQEL